ncbi:DUF3576 domain-containing protein [Sinisalibacter lacisalsi]|uniref:DUF3576 domain-containing protein n=1 Tax=Sinisalibacter lacisalsi TaxID=1526570 RepID=A0ABQ1QAA5_9RHOB|nr:DUF3576 domain-containing protein [Sinisalibacter lacisalsi]GGD19850.1 hypothetical protein GCM10011358_00560 [Sinisalibacter lacisalsi]
MRIGQTTTKVLIVAGLFALSGCGGSGLGNLFGGGQETTTTANERPQRERAEPDRETIWDLFADRDDPNTTVEVNKYLWNAARDVLNFLPLQAADPFTGVMVFGYGTPPGGGQAYKATVFVRDPALDARSIEVALQTRGGPVSAETAHRVEDAILARARQLRIQDRNL